MPPLDEHGAATGAPQLTAGDYRNPTLLPPGAVLVVGSGASGCQIAVDLCAAGRQVYPSLGRCGRRRRRYRGHDVIWWSYTMGHNDHTADAVPPPARAAYRARLTGVGGGHDLDDHQMVVDGVLLLGRPRGLADGRLVIADDLAATLNEWDASLAIHERQIDAYIEVHGLEMPPAEPARGDSAAVLASAPPRALDPREAGITNIIWATGYDYDFSWIAAPMLDGCGIPLHHRGVTPVSGLFFLGLPWLHAFKSSFIHGVGDDAAYRAEIIAARA